MKTLSNAFYVSLAVHATLSALLLFTKPPAHKIDDRSIVVNLLAVSSRSPELSEAQVIEGYSDFVSGVSKIERNQTGDSRKTLEFSYSDTTHDYFTRDAINGTDLSQLVYSSDDRGDSSESVGLQRLEADTKVSKLIARQSTQRGQSDTRHLSGIPQTKLPRTKPKVSIDGGYRLDLKQGYSADSSQNAGASGEVLARANITIDSRISMELSTVSKNNKTFIARQVNTEAHPSRQFVHTAQTSQVSSGVSVSGTKRTKSYGIESPPAIIDRTKGSNKPPIYPVAARLKGMEGSVLLRVFIDSLGRPLKIVVAQSSNFRSLDRAAVSAVKTWNFIPAKRHGHNVSAIVNVPIRFTLTDS